MARCAEAFFRAGDASASEFCLRRGRELLSTRLDALDPEDRAYYLQLTWHARIGKEARTAPSPAAAMP
jgi:hypothetical protein